jgi:DNA polymerase III alpha subunit
MELKSDFKRNTAYKLKIGDLAAGKPIVDADKLKFLELGDKQVVRVNIIANIIDKYIQEGEKKFGSLTIDDASGQIKLKAFGEDVDKFNQFTQGDTILTIGLLRQWNNEVYITPEIMKKKDPEFLLVRKLEIESEQPKTHDKSHLLALKDKILDMTKAEDSTGGVDVEKIILTLKESPQLINSEIKKLLEDGMVYEPRPGKLRYLG